MARLDRKGKRLRWDKARNAEHAYNSRLRAVAHQVGLLIKGLAPNGYVQDIATLVRALSDYAKMLDPWARSVAESMLADVYRRDSTMWRQHSKEMGRELRTVLTNSPVSGVLSALQDEQVTLIKSLPLKAAERVHALSLRALVESTRASEIAKDILATQSVTEARARLIARTEVSRASSNLVQARSEYAGSEGYFWRTVHDFDVRHSHAEMEGKYVRWSEPPTLDGMKGHAGCLPNCRCFAEPVFPDD